MKRISLLVFAVLLTLAFGAMAGHDWVSPTRLVAALSGDTSLQSQLLMVWRLPRVLAAALVGALLGLGGAIFQGVFRNPLAEPYLLGSAGGAAIGATIALLVPLGLPAGPALAGLSFLGAWGATWLVLAIAGLHGRPDTAGLLLAGVAIAAMLGALRSFLMLALSDDTVNLQVVLSWTLGGIQTPDIAGLLLLSALVIAALALSMKLARGLDLLGLGEEQAFAFGLDPARFVRIAVLLGAGIVAAAVAYGGLVAFVGLIAPHLARWWAGPRHAAMLPASALIGAALVCACDGIARAVLPPAEVPLGLITALFGGPFFLLLLARRLRA
ncbi:iron ABC transporter permease [Bosea sp. (in: a-proteobacteria)]|jgi:iron complex transport system permease protein|uniref:FecCD family ABC transporter permease n=1 Tax=Bosea sp. (in: a-proteobacteria) TaxID=1871050 RepID=UPI002DDD7DB6|nr:iron ABC transporter permease [Bosea sp. (in: a-proteobacteria)]HEV2508816.1 iron ABC transporter permease [Bosea sp. (in: a-proteobacteria)]